jgi:nitrate/nitrite transporter NarK
LPYYYYQEYGVDVKQSAFLSVLPWMLNALFSNTSGWLADGLTNNKVLTLTTARKVLQSLGSVCPALCLMYLAVGHGDEQLPMNEAVVLLTAALSMGGFQSAGFAANHQDISRRYAAVLFGITNAMSSLSGTCSVYATGLILEATSSWALVFELVSLFYLAGAISFVLFSSSEQQFE